MLNYIKRCFNNLFNNKNHLFLPQDYYYFYFKYFVKKHEQEKSKKKKSLQTKPTDK